MKILKYVILLLCSGVSYISFSSADEGFVNRQSNDKVELENSLGGEHIETQRK